MALRNSDDKGKEVPYTYDETLFLVIPFRKMRSLAVSCPATPFQVTSFSTA